MKPEIDFRVGLCPNCDRLIKRKAPADVAVCEFCYENPGCVVEVKLVTPGQFLKEIGEKFFKNHSGQRGLIEK